jgi:hypothetical protein
MSGINIKRAIESFKKNTQLFFTTMPLPNEKKIDFFLVKTILKKEKNTHTPMKN